MSNELSPMQKQRILELFLCSDDRRLEIISKTLAISEHDVSSVIQDHNDKKIRFERGNFLVFHSSINEFIEDYESERINDR